jgi:hypothetical protein
MSRALSVGTDPARAAAFLDGFLAGSGLVLIHDRSLLEIIDAWITSVNPQLFDDLLPLLRRSFARFATGERRQIGERVKQMEHGAPIDSSVLDDDIDLERAQRVIPLVESMLGLRR